MLALPFEALPQPVARPQRFGTAASRVHSALHRETSPLPDAEPLLLVVGAARSGTTWLAKIVDSHPETLYRHEPDILIDSDMLPAICRSDETSALLPAARAHLEALVSSDHLRTAGPFPHFPKTYRTWSDAMRRNSRIVTLRTLETLGVHRGLPVRAFPISCRAP